VTGDRNAVKYSH